MKKIACVLVVCAAWVFQSGAQDQGGSKAYKMNATVIEACSCPQFCQCYFNSSPAAHHDESGEMKHFCRFNNAYRVNRGTYGDTKLDGAKFWVSGDLGGDFATGQTDWAVVTFDKATSNEQRDALAAILSHVYPVKWGSLKTAEGNIRWAAARDSAHATIDGGKTAEVKLKRFAGEAADKPVVIRNLKYFGATHNDGFIMMPNEVEAYRVGDKPYEFKGTNGFMITIEADSPAAAPAAAAAGH